MTFNIRIGMAWQAFSTVPENREAYAMVAIGEHNIGFVGGCHYLWRTGAEQTFDTVSVYNLGTKAFWKFNMKEKRCHAAAVVIGNKLLIFGGQVNGTNQCLSSCESHELHGNSVCESKSIFLIEFLLLLLLWI